VATGDVQPKKPGYQLPSGGSELDSKPVANRNVKSEGGGEIFFG
jgi:hypothetical protein